MNGNSSLSAKSPFKQVACGALKQSTFPLDAQFQRMCLDQAPSNHMAPLKLCILVDINRIEEHSMVGWGVVISPPRIVCSLQSLVTVTVITCYQKGTSFSVIYSGAYSYLYWVI